MPKSIKKKKKRTSQSSPDVRMAVYRAARGIGAGKKPASRTFGQNVRYKSTPTTSVAKGRGTSTGRRSRSVRPPRPYYWETSDQGGLPRSSSVGGSRSY
jgi:hypothetical protein